MGPRWIGVAPHAPYFVDDTGAAFTPIGHNDAITWDNLACLYRRKDLAAVEAHIAMLRVHGVTVLRLMLEYAQTRHRYLERPAGSFVPDMVRLWDDLIAMCERQGMHVLLTPFDTYFTWVHFRHHPYNQANGGPLPHPSKLLTHRPTVEAIKTRLAFAAGRWGGSPAIFAWDLWNEIHPAQDEDKADGFPAFIHELATLVRDVERRTHGRGHLLTVSLFGPELEWRGHMPLQDPIFRHPDLDMATIHVYEQGTIDDPRDTVAPALAMGRIVGKALAEIRDGRPFLDSEHGPIHRFKDKRRKLPEAFDDEYFRHMQWAHVAAGGAGGGMRWPNRSPHVLTPGMHRAQKGLADMLPRLDWTRFRRRHLTADVRVSPACVAAVACGDEEQALAWLVRRDSIAADGRLDRRAPPVRAELVIPGLRPGPVQVLLWDTLAGAPAGTWTEVATPDGLSVTVERLATDVAIIVTRP
jgi:mannan endo-1,4-beta-mannosidase